MVDLVFNVQCSKFNVYFKVLKKVNYSFKLTNVEPVVSNMEPGTPIHHFFDGESGTHPPLVFNKKICIMETYT
jgi:hypothetical protein